MVPRVPGPLCPAQWTNSCTVGGKDLGYDGGGSQGVPGVVEHAGVTLSITLHWPIQHASHPVDTTTAFKVAPDNNVPTTARLQVLLAAQPNAVHIGPFEDGTLDTQVITVRKMVPITHPSSLHAPHPGSSAKSMGTLGASWGIHHQ